MLAKERGYDTIFQLMTCISFFVFFFFFAIELEEELIFLGQYEFCLYLINIYI